MGKQQLSATARRNKAAADKLMAMSPARKAKKAHAQREKRQAEKEGKNVDGLDYDHKRQAFVSIRSNRSNQYDEGVRGGTKAESGNNYNTK
tara:strand:- start:3923 stop:4195 length:273 start_codon:yes stop_codon:yes gene_type:complete